MRSLEDDPVVVFLLPLAWAACFVLAALDGLNGAVGLDINGDGAVTLRDVFMLVWSSWIVATVMPVVLLVAFLDTTAPGLLRFLEIPALLDATGTVGLVALGLASWIGLLVCIARLEREVRAMMRYLAMVRYHRRERKRWPF
ncbi:hypothetical protein [Falsiroseomonas sp.]|uniref:hypothetical protein n=1 Tax=Falsiroseomonas sp. TaxID=2870721 RepID=UPI0035619391